MKKNKIGSRKPLKNRRSLIPTWLAGHSFPVTPRQSFPAPPSTLPQKLADCKTAFLHKSDTEHRIFPRS